MPLILNSSMVAIRAVILSSVRSDFEDTAAVGTECPDLPLALLDFLDLLTVLLSVASVLWHGFCLDVGSGL